MSDRGVEPRDALPDRFWAMVLTDSSGCWYWMGSKTRDGYGKVSWHGSTRPAHRIAYWKFYGHLPIHLELDHLCRVRSCVNPTHLDPVTHRVNMIRARQSPRRAAA